MSLARDDLYIDIYNDESHIDFKRLRSFTGADVKQLSHILGVGVSTIKNNKPNTKTDQKAKDLVYALKLLARLCHNDENKMRQWFVDPKVYWGGVSPIDMFELGKAKAVISTLEAKFEAESLTYS